MALGTTHADLPLPETVEATLTDAATPTDIPVEWTDEGGYDGDIPGNYDFAAEPLGYSLADGVGAPVFTVTVSNTAALRTIKAFAELPEDIRFQRGTTPSLPDTVEGTVDGVTAQIPVTWYARATTPRTIPAAACPLSARQQARAMRRRVASARPRYISKRR